MAALVWQRAAVQEAQAAELARQRMEAKAADDARRAAARAAAEQAKADKRAAKLAAMPPQRAWKRMTPVERLLRTANVEMETYGEIRSPEAKAAYDARAAKLATPSVPPPSSAPTSTSNASGAMQPGGHLTIPKQRNVEAKKRSAEGALGCLALLVIIAVVVIAVVVYAAHSGPSGPAFTLMKQISGCTNISTTGGNSFDDNTVAEGRCQLSDLIDVNVYVWDSGDITDQHDYVYQNDRNCSSATSMLGVADDCFVGSDPQPWFIDVSTSNSTFTTSAAESDWTPVENGLGGIQVTKAPFSWCSTICTPPGHSGGGGFRFGDGD